jgi:periplasmic divalent cation tolerance protein
MNDCTVVLTTMPADDRAHVLARTLVEQRLAACVSVHAPMTSTYRWRGSVEMATERQLVIKTAPDRLAALEVRLRELHPYDLPEIVVLNGVAAEDYAAWIRESTS